MYVFKSLPWFKLIDYSRPFIIRIIIEQPAPISLPFWMLREGSFSSGRLIEESVGLRCLAILPRGKDRKLSRNGGNDFRWALIHGALHTKFNFQPFITVLQVFAPEPTCGWSVHGFLSNWCTWLSRCEEYCLSNEHVFTSFLVNRKTSGYDW